jgi:hypothetical protein
MKKEELLTEALDNVRQDRSTTEKLLNDLCTEIKDDVTTNARSGIVAAKYVEVLQKSNEQLVKILTFLQKVENSKYDLDLSKDEKNNIFELIQSEVTENVNNQ